MLPSAATRGLAALRPYIKSVRRAGCPHPAETYRHIPFPCFFLFVRLNFLLYIPREIRYNISTYFIE